MSGEGTHSREEIWTDEYVEQLQKIIENFINHPGLYTIKEAEIALNTMEELSPIDHENTIIKSVSKIWDDYYEDQEFEKILPDPIYCFLVTRLPVNYRQRMKKLVEDYRKEN